MSSDKLPLLSTYWTTGPLTIQLVDPLAGSLPITQQFYTTGEEPAPKAAPGNDFQTIEQWTVRRRLGDFGEA